MTVISIKNWSSYQSYKDRKPPWIRFHRTILDNAQYQKMTADSRALLPMLWLLACEHEDPSSGLITESHEDISWRLRISHEIVTESLQEIEAAGFIELNQTCNESVTEPLQDRNSTVTPETETETETEKELPQKIPSGLNIEKWDEWMEYRKKAKFKKLKPASIEFQQKWLVEQGDEEYQTAIIDRSIRNGYQGLFELLGVKNGTGQSEKSHESASARATRKAKEAIAAGTDH